MTASLSQQVKRLRPTRLAGLPKIQLADEKKPQNTGCDDVTTGMQKQN